MLRPGGRFAVSDVIADPDMDEQTRADMAAWTGCIAGALTETEFRAALASAGFGEIEISRDPPRPRARRRGDHPRSQARRMTRPRRSADDPPGPGRRPRRASSRSTTPASPNASRPSRRHRAQSTTSRPGSTTASRSSSPIDNDAGGRMGASRRLLRPLRLRGRRRARRLRPPRRPRPRARTHAADRALRRIRTARALQAHQPRVHRQRAQSGRTPRRRVRRGRHPTPPRQARRAMERLRARRASPRRRGDARTRPRDQARPRGPRGGRTHARWSLGRSYGWAATGCAARARAKARRRLARLALLRGSGHHDRRFARRLDRASGERPRWCDRGSRQHHRSVAVLRLTHPVSQLGAAGAAARRAELLPARAVHRLRGSPRLAGRASRRNDPARHRPLDRNALHLPLAGSREASPRRAARIPGNRRRRTAEPHLRLSRGRRPRRIARQHPARHLVA